MDNLIIGQTYKIYDIQNNGNILYSTAIYLGQNLDRSHGFNNNYNPNNPKAFTIQNLIDFKFIKK